MFFKKNDLVSTKKIFSLKDAITTFVDQYDDYCEAKEELILDINQILNKFFGDKNGVVCKDKIIEALKCIED